MTETFTVHGIEFARSGKCRQCGACGCDEEPCPHHWQRDGRHFCAIYKSRHLYCETCGTDHMLCVRFPDHPWLRVIRSGECGYRFERVDGGSMDDLPFLDEEPHLI